MDRVHVALDAPVVLPVKNDDDTLYETFKVVRDGSCTTVSKHWRSPVYGYDRAGDKPALVQGSFQQTWFTKGVINRQNDLPANVIDFTGITVPETAMINSGRTGTPGGFMIHSCRPKVALRVEEWVVNGFRHRCCDHQDAPAVIITGEDFVERQWYKDGRRHRAGGRPAYEMTTLDGRPLLRAWFVDGLMTNPPGGGPAFEAYVSTLFTSSLMVGPDHGSLDIYEIHIPKPYLFREELERAITARPPIPEEPTRGGFLHNPIGDGAVPVEQAWVEHVSDGCASASIGESPVKVIVNLGGVTFLYERRHSSSLPSPEPFLEFAALGIESEYDPDWNVDKDGGPPVVLQVDGDETTWASQDIWQ